MVKPSPAQKTRLVALREDVVSTMEGLPFLADTDLSGLLTIPLGVLRKNATQRHGVTRWRTLPSGALSVEVVDLHPSLLEDDWEDYALFVLFHEYLHALGYRAHDAQFRSMEAQWPDSKGAMRGKAFTHERRLARAAWHWVCSTCGQRFPRQRRGGGRFLCRTCRTVLVDVPVKDIE